MKALREISGHMQVSSNSWRRSQAKTSRAGYELLNPCDESGGEGESVNQSPFNHDLVRFFGENFRGVLTGHHFNSNKPITSLVRLAIHMQMIHGATKEEATQMVRYFISKLFANTT
jgi:hypothetical protein